MTHSDLLLLETLGIYKSFGNILALRDISIQVYGGEVLCLLGDNGAGKSTLIKILSGVYSQHKGSYFVQGEKVRFNSPRDALNRGIATVYQELAIIPLMSVTRNFFLGSEPTKGKGLFRRLDMKLANRVTREELAKMGVHLEDARRPAGTLSGGERQCLAIARSMYFGAKILILDEPTSALGVKEVDVVLNYIGEARSRGLGVILVTHNPNHAYSIGDRFTILTHGWSYGTFLKEDISFDEMIAMMGGEGKHYLSEDK